MPSYNYKCDNCKKIYFELRQESDPQWIMTCDVCAGSFLEVEDTDPPRVEPEKPLEGMQEIIIDAEIVQSEIAAPIQAEKATDEYLISIGIMSPPPEEPTV